MTREQQLEVLETLFEKMSREDWLAGEGFSGKVGGLTKIPHICKPRIFDFAIEISNVKLDEAKKVVSKGFRMWVEQKREKGEEPILERFILDAFESLKIPNAETT